MATEMNRAEMVITVLLLSHGRSHWFKSSIAHPNSPEGKELESLLITGGSM